MREDRLSELERAYQEASMLSSQGGSYEANIALYAVCTLERCLTRLDGALRDLADALRKLDKIAEELSEDEDEE